MKRSIIFATFLFFTCLTTKAQRDFRLGYIILNSNDTLKGKIDYRGDLLNSKVCQFYDFFEGKVIRYTPMMIKEYGFYHQKKYVAREVETENGIKPVFLEYLVKGELNIFYYRAKEADHYLVEKTGFPLKELPYEEHERTEKKFLYIVKSKKHIGILKYVLQDCPEIYKEIEAIQRPNHDNLVQLAKNYHKLICPDGACQIYKKEYPFLKLSIEPIFGEISIKNELSQKASTSVYGGLLYFWLPRINEKLFFRTGFIHTQTFSFPAHSTNDYNDHIYSSDAPETLVYNKIPLQVYYKYPKGRIKPTLGYGAIYYPLSAVKAAGNLGLNIYISKNLALAMEGEVEFNSKLFFIPDSYWASTLSFGLVFDF